MEREHTVQVVIVNRPMSPFDVRIYQLAADEHSDLHCEVMQPGERFINPTTNRGEAAPETSPYMYITGPVGSLRSLEESAASIRSKLVRIRATNGNSIT